MFILQTLREFVDNPMGKGSNALPGRQLIKDDLKARFEKILDHKDKWSNPTIYKKNDDYYFHFLIPSEDLRRNNTYDVVLHFISDENTKGEKNLNNYMVKFFSNSPGFTYTYAYAFNLYGLFVEELDHKFDEKTLESPPVTRNPGEIISYEKTTFFASTFLLKETKYFSKSVIDLISKKYSETDFAKKIRNTDKIEVEIKREVNRVKREEETAGVKSSGVKKVIDPTKIGGKDKKTPVMSTQPRNSKLELFKDKGKITPRTTTRSKIRPK